MPVKIELLQFEPNTVCNLRCPICPATNKQRSHHHVEPERYRQIIGRSFEPPYLLILSGFSETLLHPRLEEIIRFEKERGCQVFLASNASVLGSQRARSLLAAGVDQFVISLDTLDADLFARIRRGTSFQQITSNLEMLRELITQSGSRCRLTVNAVVTAATAGGLSALLEYVAARELGEVALIKIMKMAGMNDPFLMQQFLDWHQYRNAVDWQALREVAARHSLAVMYSDDSVIKQQGCHLPGKSFYLSADFQLSTCPFLSFLPQYVFGNLLEESIEEITSSRRYREFTATFARGRHLPECESCACLFSPLS